MKMEKFWFFVVVLLFIGEIFGETLIVSSNGTVNSNCNETTPCSIENALNLAKESDIIFCQDGTYYISQVLYITVGNLTLVGQSQENTILDLSIQSGSGINSTFPFQISNFTFLGSGNFNSTLLKSNVISILPPTSNSSFPFNISTRIENITFNGNFTGLVSLIGCKELTTPIYITNLFFNATLTPTATFTFFVFIESFEDIIIDQITSNNGQATEMFYLESFGKNLYASNFNITNADTDTMFECRANSTIFTSIIIQYSETSFCPFEIYSNYTVFNHLVYETSSGSIMGVITVGYFLNFYVNDTYIDSPYFTIDSFESSGNITIENSKIVNADISFGLADSITLTNNYFNNNNHYLATQSPKTIIKNCTLENFKFYQNQFANADENYLFVSNSQFIGADYNTFGYKIELLVYDYTQLANQTITALFEETSFVNIPTPVYGFIGAMNVTFNNCEFEGLGNPWVYSCPTNGSTLYFIGNLTELEDPNVLIADDDVECNLYCSSNFDVICERGADKESPISIYVWISISLFVIIATIIIIAVTIFIVKKKLNPRSSYDTLSNDPLN